MGISLPNNSIILSNHNSGAKFGLAPLNGGLQSTKLTFLFHSLVSD
jgi:hypothetical protein